MKVVIVSMPKMQFISFTMQPMCGILCSKAINNHTSKLFLESDIVPSVLWGS